MPKVHDVIECQARDPRQMKEHKKLVNMKVFSLVGTCRNIGKSCVMYVRK